MREDVAAVRFLAGEVESADNVSLVFCGPSFVKRYSRTEGAFSPFTTLPAKHKNVPFAELTILSYSLLAPKLGGSLSSSLIGSLLEIITAPVRAWLNACFADSDTLGLALFE